MGGADTDSRIRDGDAEFQLGRDLVAKAELEAAQIHLRRAAALGHVDGTALLGEQFFLTPPPIPSALVEEGIKFTLAAANAGHPAALHLAAVIAASYDAIPNHWQQALDFLARAAAAGHKLAPYELAFLARDGAVMAQLAQRAPIASDTWHRLAASIDIAALTAAKPPRVVSKSPYIAMAENVIPHDMCDWITRRARPLLKPARIYNPPGASNIVRRTNTDVTYPFPEYDMVLCVLRQRIANATGYALDKMELPAILHYVPGQEFSQHYDFLDPRVPAFAAEIEKFGQRMATSLTYLSDDFDGGETDFTKVDIRLRGKKGDALIFHNVEPSGAPDYQSLHAGRPTTRGEKWLVSQWIRGDKPPV